MAPSARTNEFTVLQQEITNEIGRDAPEIAKGVFGDNANHPDMASVSNAQLDDLYRQKYLANDRQWLQGEARRDPQQFLDVAKRIGVAMPPPTPPGVTPEAQPTLDPQKMLANLQANAAAPQGPPVPAAAVAPPAAAPVPPIQPALPAAPGVPVAGPVVGAPPVSAPAVPLILGPNGQPLPPSIPGVTG